MLGYLFLTWLIGGPALVLCAMRWDARREQPSPFLRSVSRNSRKSRDRVSGVGA